MQLGISKQSLQKHHVLVATKNRTNIIKYK